MKSIFERSTEFLTRAERIIPLGSQTFSKSKAQYPVGFAPLFADKAKGAYLWDVDGNKYVDLVSNLASVTLGYADKAQNQHVWRQMKMSAGMSLPSRLETYVAEKVSELVPSAEMIRFAKNGSDATSAAIRLSRAYTSRDHVVVCGYHGWQDWYIGSTSRRKGVPTSIQALTHTFKYNDLSSLEHVFKEYKDKIACVVLEPMNHTYPIDGFLQSVINLCEQNGAICVFDETITGFRFSEGGAQQLFGVTPHLSTFGKGIANGFPLSVICGRREIMNEMNHIFFSGTFGGELLSLSAADYVLDKHLQNLVIPELTRIGEDLVRHQREIVDKYALSQVLKFSGHPSWIFYEWRDSDKYSAIQLKSLFAQEIFQRGLLLINTNNISLSHKGKASKRILQIFDAALREVKDALESDSVLKRLKYAPLDPVMKIR